MSPSCGKKQLFWTVRRVERHPSMSNGSRAEYKSRRMSGCTCSPTAPFLFQRWRAEEETNQMKGFISALLRTSMEQS